MLYVYISEKKRKRKKAKWLYICAVCVCECGVRKGCVSREVVELKPYSLIVIIAQAGRSSSTLILGFPYLCANCFFKKAIFIHHLPMPPQQPNGNCCCRRRWKLDDVEILDGNSPRRDSQPARFISYFNNLKIKFFFFLSLPLFTTTTWRLTFRALFFPIPPPISFLVSIFLYEYIGSGFSILHLVHVCCSQVIHHRLWFWI